MEQQEPFHLTLSTPVRQALRVLPVGTMSRLLIRSCVHIIEKRIGSPLLVTVPESLEHLGRNPFEMQDVLATLEALKKAGVIKHVTPHERQYADEPELHLFHVSTETEDARGAGADFFSERNALWKATGEAVERYLFRHLDFFSGEAIIRTPTELKGSKLDLDSLSGFSEKQKKVNPCLAHDTHTPFSWLLIRSLTHKRNVYYPTQLLSSLYARSCVKSNSQPDAQEPMLRWSITTGLATGQTKEEAMLRGTLEIIERDALMITHLTRIEPKQIDLEYLKQQDTELRWMLEQFARHHLTVHLLLIPTDFPVFVVGATITDSTGKGPAISIGSKAGTDLKDIIAGALSEALLIRFEQKRMFGKATNIDVNTMHRKERLAYWMQENRAEKLDYLKQGSVEKVSITPETRPTKDVLKKLVASFREKGYDLACANLGSKETIRCGLHTVRMISPELQPMHLNESIPYVSGLRLQEVPKKLGHKLPQELNTDPHPFA